LINSQSSATPREGDIKDDTASGIRSKYTGGQWQPFQSIPKSTPINTPPTNNNGSQQPNNQNNQPPANNTPVNTGLAINNQSMANPSSGVSLLEMLKQDENWNKLPQDLKDLMTIQDRVLSENDVEKQKKYLKALNEAYDQTNIYLKEAISITQDSLKSTLDSSVKDYEYQEKDLQTKIARLKENLATAKGDMDIDQQAELARQKAKYENDLDGLRESASSTGLTFSSKRNLAEGQLATQNTDIVESTAREYMRKARDLELGASRGEADAISQLAEYKRKLGEQQMQTLRSVESKIGTANLPTGFNLLPGVSAKGNVRGEFEETKIKDIFSRATALSSLGNPFL